MIPAKKVAKLDKPATRLAAASDKTVVGTLFDAVSAHAGTTYHVCLSRSMVNSGCAESVGALAMPNVETASGVGFDLYPDQDKRGADGIGADELLGLVQIAVDVAEVLRDEPDAAVVVSDRLGRDFARIVCVWAAQMVRFTGGGRDLGKALRRGVAPPVSKKYKRLVTGCFAKAKSPAVLREAVRSFYRDAPFDF